MFPRFGTKMEHFTPKRFKVVKIAILDDNRPGPAKEVGLYIGMVIQNRIPAHIDC